LKFCPEKRTSFVVVAKGREKIMRSQDLEERNARGITGYLLVMRGKEWDEGLSEAELLQVMDRTTKWFEDLMKTGKVRGGNALLREGAVVSGRGGNMITDGPYAESKEAIGGYLLLDVATLAEAVEIAKTSPGVDYGMSVEVRPVTNECPVFKRVRERLRLVAA
jgi:hypothetical protein